MADRVEGSPEASAPMEPDTSENAPLLQEQEHQNVNLGPPPPFIASKWILQLTWVEDRFLDWTNFQTPLTYIRDRLFTFERCCYIAYIFIALFSPLKVFVKDEKKDKTEENTAHFHS